MNALSKFAKDRRGAVAEIARKAGASHAQVSRIAQGKSRPSLDLAKRIEAATEGAVTAASLLGVAGIEGGVRAKPLADGRWFAPVKASAPVELPSELLEGFGFHDGDALIFRRTAEGFEVISQRRHIRRIQDELRKLVPEGVSLTDELIAERRAEAARE
jgi:transcriptional regulator with XRE-family HTH domain